MPTFLITFVSVLAGGAAAAATLVGVVNAQTGPPGDSPATVGNVSIDETSYGSTQ